VSTGWTSLARHLELPEDEYSLQIIHSEGVISLLDPEGCETPEGLAFRGVVDVETWEAIRSYDAFGAASRTREPGPLDENSPLKITLLNVGPQLTDFSHIPAEAFVIVEAMHQFSPDELASAGLEGEVWTGVRFSTPEPWQRAIDRFSAHGFALADGLVGAVTLRHQDDPVSIEFRRLESPDVIRVQAVFPMPMGEDVNPAIYELLNRINRRVAFGLVVIDAGDLLVRHSFPEPLEAGSPELIADKLAELLGLLGTVLGPLFGVASGEMTLDEGDAAIFG
jgi:hypothetical protein